MAKRGREKAGKGERRRGDKERMKERKRKRKEKESKRKRERDRETYLKYLSVSQILLIPKKIVEYKLTNTHFS